MTADPVSNLAGEPALIERAQGGELAAFDQLVLHHQQAVFAVALRMLGNWDEAQDIAQDVFVRAYQAIRTFRREAKLSTWLISITMNLCRNRRRWWARRKGLIVASLDDSADSEQESLGQQVADPSPGPAAVTQQREQRQHILRALEQLDQAHRSVIVLRDLQGYSYEEIAQMLGCRVGTVKSRISRARHALRALLGEQDR